MNIYLHNMFMRVRDQLLTLSCFLVMCYSCRVEFQAAHGAAIPVAENSYIWKFLLCLCVMLCLFKW